MTRFILALLLVLAPAPVFAQTNTSPNFTQGVLPSAAQWNGYFSGKVDATNGQALGLTMMNGQTGSSSVSAGAFTGGGGAINVYPNLQLNAYNALANTGDAALISGSAISTSNVLALLPWSNTKSGLRLLGTGVVQSAGLTLDDGVAAYPFILTSGGLGAHTYASGALGAWFSGVGVQANATAATNSPAFAVMSADDVTAFQVTTGGNVTIKGSPVTAANTPGAAVSALTVGTSPYAYTASLRGSVAVSGGTVSAVTITRGGVVVPTGALAGMFPVMNGDIVTVTYSAAPTMNFIPE